jgi:hypothetical protein
LGDGLLHLQDHVRLLPHVLGGVHDLGACPLEAALRNGGAVAGRLLDDHAMARPRELADALGRDGHPVLGVLDLLGDPDDHGASSRRA